MNSSLNGKVYCEFVVHGEPVPKQSFRVVEARHGSKRGFVDPRVLAWETAVRLAARLSLAEQNKEILQESLRTCQQLGIEIRTRNMQVNGVDVVVMVLPNAKIEAGNIHLEGA